MKLPNSKYVNNNIMKKPPYLLVRRPFLIEWESLYNIQ